MPTENRGVIRSDIIEDHPDLVKALEQAFKKLPKTNKYISRRYSFSGLYLHRRLTWARIFETLEDAGYKIKIEAHKK